MLMVRCSCVLLRGLWRQELNHERTLKDAQELNSSKTQQDIKSGVFKPTIDSKYYLFTHQHWGKVCSHSSKYGGGSNKAFSLWWSGSDGSFNPITEGEQTELGQREWFFVIWKTPYHWSERVFPDHKHKFSCPHSTCSTLRLEGHMRTFRDSPTIAPTLTVWQARATWKLQVGRTLKYLDTYQFPN